jgi:hypothetical protein
MARRDEEVELATRRVSSLEEEIRKLESINRIQQTEIDELSAVVARNLERIKAETRDLAAGGRLPAMRHDEGPVAVEP